ncbi:CPBP family intramembrane glutamic endopeptidase [uncultured Nocardioides sp.]|uniref:CPBP family intramembrane glutamic endopeptidase n=1 Tax=uncultured Nocardioides sp. TaxID=198441 RepID=UPI0025D294B2|nr:type II CAAX endopeptidase family protein [uncultured Nocardioides sp.]
MSRPLREATIYLALVFSLAIGIAVAMPHAGINVLLSAFAPIAALVLITFTVTPRGRRRAVWAEFGLNRSGTHVWAFALVVPMLLAGSAYGVALVLDVADLRSLDFTSAGVAVWSLNLASTLVFMTVLFLAEEIGWRGYLLPRVQQLSSRRRAALVTGFVHGCFHLPLLLIASTYDEHGSRWLVAPIVVATITMGGVFYAYLWDRTHSVWPVAMAHGAVNTAFGIGAGAVVATSEADLAYVAGESGIATFAAVAVVGAAFLARAKVWRTDARARNTSSREVSPVA